MRIKAPHMRLFNSNANAFVIVDNWMCVCVSYYISKAKLIYMISPFLPEAFSPQV